MRQALFDSHDGDTINFDASLNGQTVTLITAELTIAKNVTISGPGANLLAVSRDQNASAFRIFNVAPNHSVSIQGLTISNGLVTNSFGGGIYNQGSQHPVKLPSSCATGFLDFARNDTHHGLADQSS